MSSELNNSSRFVYFFFVPENMLFFDIMIMSNLLTLNYNLFWYLILDFMVVFPPTPHPKFESLIRKIFEKENLLSVCSFGNNRFPYTNVSGTCKSVGDTDNMAITKTIVFSENKYHSI
ncbi:hypothetical protein BDC45DRAFT_541222 [Circinella umbellata]|nr:hypothetical protein BDC45DRAFT_541222 [Circinella umbellata]